MSFSTRQPGGRFNSSPQNDSPQHTETTASSTNAPPDIDLNIPEMTTDRGDAQ
jgi:hypothetical protein